jgi:hypothetical protein
MPLEFGTISAVAGLLGLSAKDLWESVEKRRQTARAQQLQAVLAKKQHLRHAGIVRKALAAYYDEPRLKPSGLGLYRVRIDGWDVETAIATRANWIRQRVALGSSAERCTLVRTAEPRIQAPQRMVESYIESADAQEKPLWNGRVYRLRSINFDNRKLCAEFAVAQFFQFLFTHGLLSEELEDALESTDGHVPDVVARAHELLPLRQALLGSGAQVADLSSRFAVGGPDVLVALARPSPHDDFALLLQHRSSIVSGDAGMLAVIPMGYHAPIVDAEAEVPVSSSVYREFFEELCGGEEAIRDTRRFSPDWYFQQCPAVGWFRRNRGAYELTCTSFGISLAIGGAQFSVLLAVSSEQYWAAHERDLVANWETDLLGGRHVVSSRDRKRISELLHRSDWNAGSIMSFAEGLLLLKERYPSRVDLPTMECGLL